MDIEKKYFITKILLALFVIIALGLGSYVTYDKLIAKNDCDVKEATKNIGRKKISYDVLRKGW